MDFNNRLLWQDIFNGDEEDAVEDMEIPRVVLQQTNPFETLSDHKFVQLFRLNKNSVHEVVEMVEPFMVQPRRASALSITTKVLAALRFYASGSHQEITGSNHFLGISQPSLSRSIAEVTNALNQPVILNAKISFPRTQADREALRTRFFQMYGFPGKIANACALLHNMCIDNNLPEVLEPHPVAEPDYGMYHIHNFDAVRRVAANPDLVAARQLQHNIIINHFNRP